MKAPTVSLRHITRRFGPVVANDDVSLDLVPGRIHALVGENGAGKTTLMRVLYGLLAPDAGRIEIDGRPVTLKRPADAMRLGLGMVHQHFMLVGPLTAAENICLGREPAGALGSIEPARARQMAAELAARTRLPVDPGARVESLSVGEQQRVEILRALHHGARLLILDEPTAVLAPHEVDDLFRVLREFVRTGASVVLITHKLGEVTSVADEVTVMRSSRVVGGGRVADFSAAELAELMVGRRPAAPARPDDRPPGDCLLAVRGLEVRDDRGLAAVRGVSFEVRAGEIVGVAGVEGNGQGELIECVAGLRRARRGEVEIAGRRRAGAAAEPARGTLAHIPSDRLRRGIVPGFTLAENLVLGRHRQAATGGGWLSRRTLLALSRPLLQEFDVRPPDPTLRIEQLSGGNQQKLVVARELTRGAQVVLAAHPTRGVDLGAVESIHARLLAERSAGRAVLLVSSELSEILALSDRILVIYEGRIVHECERAAADERTLGLAMAGKGSG